MIQQHNQSTAEASQEASSPTFIEPTPQIGGRAQQIALDTAMLEQSLKAAGYLVIQQHSPVDLHQGFAEPVVAKSLYMDHFNDLVVFLTLRRASFVFLYQYDSEARKARFNYSSHEFNPPIS